MKKTDGMVMRLTVRTAAPIQKTRAYPPEHRWRRWQTVLVGWMVQRHICEGISMSDYAAEAARRHAAQQKEAADLRNATWQEREKYNAAFAAAQKK
jgi:hypothetical protein